MHNKTTTKKTPSVKHPFVIIRARDSGVTAGYLVSRSGREVKLRDAIRIWRWSGAFTLFQMALEGVAKPGDCKFSISIPEIEILDACEVIPCSATAQSNLEEVPRCRA